MTLEIIQQTIREAAASARPLRIRGGGSKDFYGGPLAGDLLNTSALSGIVAHEPTELVVTVRGGTALAELEAVLAQKGQMLAFEPPHFGAATVGGTVACGFSGPRRATVGALRDFVLGASIVDGRGELLRFGGQVMKNVAGYDVSRLMAGAMGTLGLIVEVSFKVLPLPPAEASLMMEMPEDRAIEIMNRWAERPLPISASCWSGGELFVRLSGASAAVGAARAQLGGEDLAEAQGFWHSLREHSHPFFGGDAPLWRLSLPSTAPPLSLRGEQLIEWGGGQRWLRSHAEGYAVREAAREAGGHATLFRASDRSDAAFAPLSAPLMKVQRRLKQAFDPAGIFNPGRLYDF